MQSNVNSVLVQKWIDAWIANDIDKLDEIFARDYKVNGTLVGVEGVKQAVQFLHSAFSNISAELHETVAAEDKVAIRWAIRARHTGNFMGIPPTGKEVELTGINIYQIVDDEILCNQEQTNILEVIQILKANHEVDMPK
jgi:steroid delta-isomerase-like uncharacterized protein